MSKAITLALKKSLIIEAAKADTYQSGQVDKSADPVKNAGLAFNEQAGDETYQERKLIRFLRSGLAKFAAVMNEFVDSEAGSIRYTLTDENDEIDIVVVVSSRYNDGLAQPLSSIAEEYVTYIVDYMWWQPIKPNLAKDYLSYAQESLSFIRLCLAKNAPKASQYDYTDVTGYVNEGGESAVIIVSTVNYDDTGTPHGFKFPASTIINNYLTHQNVGYRSTDPSASFTLVKSGETTPILTGLGETHAFTSSEVMAIQMALGGETSTNLVLVPKSAIDASNKITFSYSENSN